MFFPCAFLRIGAPPPLFKIRSGATGHHGGLATNTYTTHSQHNFRIRYMTHLGRIPFDKRAKTVLDSSDFCFICKTETGSDQTLRSGFKTL